MRSFVLFSELRDAGTASIGNTFCSPRKTSVSVPSLPEPVRVDTMDNSTLTSLYAAHAKNLYNYILWMTRNTESSKDILQIIFIRLWKSADAPTDEDEVRRWLFTAAKNACMDSFRSHARLTRLRSHYTAEFASIQDDPHDGIFWDLLSELSDIERCILYLHLKAGYSYAEIGRIVDLSESNVRVKACRAIKRLRDVGARSLSDG